MESLKRIDRVVTSEPVNLAEITMKQPLPAGGIKDLDPFLIIQHGAGALAPRTNYKKAGVGPHPHRGFSPVTFIFKGSIHHRDSRNNSEVVHEGGTQWMHAGRGIIHSERPGKELAKKGGESEIVQFWVNSPAAHKMDTPSYQPISKEETPVIKKGQSEIAVVAGEFEGIVGPADILSPQILLHTPGTFQHEY